MQELERQKDRIGLNKCGYTISVVLLTLLFLNDLIYRSVLWPINAKSLQLWLETGLENSEKMFYKVKSSVVFSVYNRLNEVQAFLHLNLNLA